MGEIIIELYWNHAPNTCRNFAELCRRGYYAGTKFHRIIRDFMIQGKQVFNIQISAKLILIMLILIILILGGDPTGTGRGGASIYGRNFSDEIHEELKHTGDSIVFFSCTVHVHVLRF